MCSLKLPSEHNKNYTGISNNIIQKTSLGIKQEKYMIEPLLQANNLRLTMRNNTFS